MNKKIELSDSEIQTILYALAYLEIFGVDHTQKTVENNSKNIRKKLKTKK